MQKACQELQIDNPLAFKQELEVSKLELQQLKQDLLEKQQRLRTQELLQNDKEAERKTIISELKSLSKWVQTQLSPRSICANHDEEEDAEETIEAVAAVDPQFLKEVQRLRQ